MGMCSKRKKKDHHKKHNHHSDDRWEHNDDHGKDDHHEDHHKKHKKHKKKNCKDHHKENCVEEVLEAILKAQKKVKVKREKVCKVSCKESIKELLEEEKKPKKNTVPFILYCDCEPFKGTGVTTFTSHSKKKKFACISTFIFRIKDLDDNCAVLELLTFKPKKCCHEDSGKKCDHKEPSSPCRQIDHKDVDDLIRTGICITVDLSCFCAISCLPAIKL
ncbi:spore coat protein [Bacillus sp. FJAT-49705]|uniref:Spore coat protein n=1 Tax=Cytobacillus citreus TaxID=2833586 RepID=A0ABS5NY02_9BACI|nr:CotY/CotZ family spore coat protein [Cytobacillus citreus]MBS4192717.1 spore coat protein [Cytobacillus citreus]